MDGFSMYEKLVELSVQMRPLTLVIGLIDDCEASYLGRKKDSSSLLLVIVKGAIESLIKIWAY